MKKYVWVIAVLCGVLLLSINTLSVAATNIQNTEYSGEEYEEEVYEPKLLLKTSHNLKKYSTFLKLIEDAEYKYDVESGTVEEFTKYDGIILTQGAYPPWQNVLIEEYIRTGGSALIIGGKEVGGLKHLVEYNNYWLGVGLTKDEINAITPTFVENPLTYNVTTFAAEKAYNLKILGKTNELIRIVESVVFIGHYNLITLTAYGEGVVIVTAGDIISDATITQNNILTKNILATIGWRKYAHQTIKLIEETVSVAVNNIESKIRPLIWAFDSEGRCEYGMLLLTTPDLFVETTFFSSLTINIDAAFRTLEAIETVKFDTKITKITGELSTLSGKTITRITAKISETLVLSEWSEKTIFTALRHTGGLSTDHTDLILNDTVTLADNPNYYTFHCIDIIKDSITTSIHLNTFNIPKFQVIPQHPFFSILVTIIGGVLHYFYYISTATFWYIIGFETAVIAFSAIAFIFWGYLIIIG